MDGEGVLHIVEVKRTAERSPELHPAALLGARRRATMRQAALLLLERLSHGEVLRDETADGPALPVLQSLCDQLRGGKIPSISLDLIVCRRLEIVEYFEAVL